MKKIIRLCMVSMFFIPVFSLAALEKSMVNEGTGVTPVMLIADAELQPADAEKNSAVENKSEDAKPVEEKKDNKVGFIAGVLIMVLFMVIILMKTRGIEK